MGSSGMKRKNRTHLQKVGTKTEERQLQEHEREAIVENFGIHPSGRNARLWSVVGAVLVLFGILALLGWVFMT